MQVIPSPHFHIAYFISNGPSHLVWGMLLAQVASSDGVSVMLSVEASCTALIKPMNRCVTSWLPGTTCAFYFYRVQARKHKATAVLLFFWTVPLKVIGRHFMDNSESTCKWMSCMLVEWGTVVSNSWVIDFSVYGEQVNLWGPCMLPPYCLAHV